MIDLNVTPDPLERRHLTLLELLELHKHSDCAVVSQSGASSLVDDLWLSTDTQTHRQVSSCHQVTHRS